jgi:uncharacterized protein YwqG
MNCFLKRRIVGFRVFPILLVLIFCFAVLSGCANNQNKNDSGRNNMSFLDLLQPMQKSSIRIEFDVKTETESPVGSSKIGGNPDLPSNFEWFYFQGESYEGISANRPLSFLAQINCEEASKYDKDLILPPKGMLYFFYEFATMTWGFNPQDKGSAKVYYYSGDISGLSRTKFPLDLLEEYKIPEMTITFSSENELPDYEEFVEWHEGFDYKQWDEYDKAKSKLILESDEETVSKLLGYANLIQGGMLLQCELTTSGINTGNSDGYSNVSAQQKEDSTKWQLLFQLDSIQTDKYEMLWGDVGRIYFYIEIDDLKALNFENSWLILQCY